MPSLRRHEGNIVIDHRESPGLTAEDVRKMGKWAKYYPREALGRGKFYESATYTCPYCKKGVVINPLRTRERHYDRRTDHYICDDCALLRKLGVKLRLFWQKAEEQVRQVGSAIANLRKDILNG